jgi:hypothetical protein
MGVGTYYGVQHTKIYVNNPPEQVHASYRGKTITMMDTVESLTATGLDAGSVITMFRPPKGARWNGVGAIWSDDLGSSVTLSVGISGAATKFGAATSHASATKTLLGLAADIDAVQYEFDGATDVIVTTAGATMTTAKTITLMMQFVVA